MDTILQYVKNYGNESFGQRKFCATDGLILAQLSYINYGNIVPKIKDLSEPIPLYSIWKHPDMEKMFHGGAFEKENRKLLRLAAKSKRFGKIKLNFYTDVFVPERELQFSAVTYFISSKVIALAFRGTDETINGWKENFNMVSYFPVPAQVYAAAYVNRIASFRTEKIILCGHSKGGNLAVYGAFKCKTEVKKRILRVYNFDGPGFCNREIYEKDGETIIPKIRKYVVPESFVGLLLYNYGPVYMVNSNARGMAQHDPYRWQIESTKLSHATDFNRSKRAEGEQLNERILSLPECEVRKVIEAFFVLAKDLDVTKISQIKSDVVFQFLKSFPAQSMEEKSAVRVLRQILMYMLLGRKYIL